MAAPASLFHILLNILAIFSLLQQAATFPITARLDSSGVDGSHGPLSIPKTNDAGDSTGGGDGTDGQVGSTQVIADQPATVQLGAGFIVGCVIGVVLYTVTRLGKRVVQQSVVERRERGRGDPGELAEQRVLVEV